MDLPKAFDLHISKFPGFGFDKNNLKIILITWIIHDIGQN